jgi:hypothetical protein
VEPTVVADEAHRTTDDEARAIASSRDPARTLALCRASPPDRAATLRACVLAACAADELALARSWVRTALGQKRLHPHAVDVMNECGKRLLPPR